MLGLLESSLVAGLMCATRKVWQSELRWLTRTATAF